MSHSHNTATNEARADEFRELRFGAWQGLVRPVWASPVESAFSKLGLPRAAALDDLGLARFAGQGRSQPWLLDVESQTGVSTLLVRPARHGGLLAPISGARFLSSRRIRNELLVHAALHARGAPVAEPVFALWRRRGAHVEAAFATRYIEGAQDGIAFLSTPAAHPLSPRIAAECAQAIRRFHDAGGQHADLHLKNLLVEEHAAGALRFWLIDLDRARVSSEVTPRRRIRELMRLARSLRKRGFESALEPALQRSFLAAYCDGDDALRHAMLAHHGRERVRNDLHALFASRVVR